ncbi:ParB N-terminal domain-containing protein [Bradyrhizobium sp. I71]|uniref:ParB/RepB/Spo0J family partition protein n=1 Tax=Bradyrhizobium sp. I71 TaxID=2590772 RepID=UPI001EF75C84|nr:ParB N-terminal domain-containing protein [Bradyrhizobium sp. I71]ULK98869.1 ParB N-terminal domain-containing protein [Bradyrhizobium sp. I71]
MDIKVPLKMLKFGHEDGEGINARVAGREDGIAALAANIFANRSEKNPSGLIENLIVKEAGDDFYSVANGNRRLAALRMIEAEGSELPIPCTMHQVDETKAFEYSLTTAITAEQLHPVDQYEAFARLEEHGKTQDEIAQQYGMKARQVQQALALGRLSPKIRDAWRKGDIKAEVAQAFTLALDHATQDKLFAQLDKAHAVTVHNVKRELGAYATDEEVAQLLNVVGTEAYRAAGGHVTEDLFGTSHIISDDTLLKQLARQLLIAKCEELTALGWGWAEILSDLPQGARFWPVLEVKTKIFEGDEEQRLAQIRARLEAIDEEVDITDELEQEQDRLALDADAIEQAVKLRSYPDKKRKQLGCIVTIEEGRLVVLAGIKRPQEATAPARNDDDDDAGDTGARKTPPAAAEAPEEPAVSNALLHRLSVQLTQAAATALIEDTPLALAVLLAGFDTYGGNGVKVSVSGLGMGGAPGRLFGQPDDLPRTLALAMKLKPNEKMELLVQVAAGALDFQNKSLDGGTDQHDSTVAICNAIEPKALNAALRGAFDAKDYFAGVNKALCLKAIEEALGADIARQQAKGSKAEIAAFALENVPTTGWLPPQLRAKGYDGPPVKKPSGKLAPARGKKPAKAAAKKTAKKVTKKTATKKRKAA